MSYVYCRLVERPDGAPVDDVWLASVPVPGDWIIINNQSSHKGWVVKRAIYRALGENPRSPNTRDVPDVLLVVAAEVREPVLMP